MPPVPFHLCSACWLTGAVCWEGASPDPLIAHQQEKFSSLAAGRQNSNSVHSPRGGEKKLQVGGKLKGHGCTFSFYTLDQEYARSTEDIRAEGRWWSYQTALGLFAVQMGQIAPSKAPTCASSWLALAPRGWADWAAWRTPLPCPQPMIF